MKGWFKMKAKYCNFLDDREKMRDFKTLSKKEFLASYSYLTETEYQLTWGILEDSLFCIH